MASHGIQGIRSNRYETVGYVSVSSREQGENSHAKEQQIARLVSEGCDVVFWDVESRYKGRMRLDSQQEVLKIVEETRCKRVVVTRVDRLSRKNSRTFNIYDLFIKSGVELKVLDEPIDLTNAAGKMVAGMVAVMAQHHSDQKAEAVRHGWQHLRGRKVAMNPPFGYVKKNDRHQLDHAPFLCLLEPQKELSKSAIARMLVDAYFEAKTLRGAIKWLNQTFGIMTTAHNNGDGQKGGKVARGLFRFSVGGLRNWLTNQVLLGHTQYLAGQGYKDRKTVIHYDTHPDDRLISEDERKMIDDLLTHNRQVKGFGSTRLKYPLSGLVFCGECQSVHYSVTGSQNYHRAKKLGIPQIIKGYFQCKNWRTRGCSQKTMIGMENAEASIISALVDRAAEVAEYADRVPDIVESPELSRLRNELSLYESMPGNRSLQIIIELQTEIETIRRTLEGKSNLYTENRSLLLTTFSNPLFWETVDIDKKRQIYRDLVARVVVKDGGVIEVKLKV